MKVAILAPGPSMFQGLADSLRAENCIAVNNCYQLAPWAMALCAQDRAWWREHPDAMRFAGRKFSTNRIEGAEQIRADQFLSTQSSSGCVALMVADIVFGAKEIDLHGFDMHGTHFFGPYTGKLRNTSPTRFEEFQIQFAKIAQHFAKRGVKVVNRTPGSALRCFPIEAP